MANYLCKSELAENIFEVVEAGLAHDPFGGEYRAFGKRSPRLYLVAKDYSIARRRKFQGMYPHHIALAFRRDLCLDAGCLGHDSLQRHRCSRRRIFLVDVVPFGDVSGVSVLQSRRSRAGDLEEQ